MAKLNLNFNNNFDDFLSKLEDLSKISDKIRININSEEIFMYSIDGEPILVALKNFTLSTSNYFELKIENTVVVIIENLKKFVKGLKFIKSSDKVSLSIDYRDEEGQYISRYIQLKTSKLKIGTSCSELSEIKNITKEALLSRISPSNRRWKFELSSETFSEIKSLSKINSENKTITISTDKGNVLISESSEWEYDVDKIEFLSSRSFSIGKGLLSCIRDSDIMTFHIFDTFLLVQDDNSNLLISFETDFSDED